MSLTKRRFAYLSLGLLVLFLACTYIWFWQDGWTEGRVEQAINESLPINSTRDQVERWLKEMNWTNYNFFAAAGGDHIGHQTVSQVAGLDERTLSNMIKVIVPNPKVDLISPGLIYVYFFFDLDGRLVKYYIYPQVFSL